MGPTFLGLKLSHASPHLIPNHFQDILSEKLRLREVSGSTLGLFLCPRFQPSLYTVGSTLGAQQGRGVETQEPGGQTPAAPPLPQLRDLGRAAQARESTEQVICVLFLLRFPLPCSEKRAGLGVPLPPGLCIRQ